MYFPVNGTGYCGFNIEYIKQEHFYKQDHDFASDIKSLEFNKFNFGDDYFWLVNISVNPNSPSYTSWDLDDWDKFKVNIPIQVRNEIIRGKALLAVDYSLEGYADINWDLLIKTFHPIPKEKIVYITSLYNPEILDTDIPCYYTNRWETNLLESYIVGSNKKVVDHDADWRMFEKQIKLINRLHPRRNTFTSYNRRPREHRLALLGSLSEHDLLDDAIYSWGGNFEGNYDDDSLCMHVNRTYFNNSKRDKKFDHLMKISKKIVTHDVEFDTNPAWLFNWHHIFCTNFQLISETDANQRSTFLSEKSFKPFASGQPFVTWGDVNTVQALREHGYDVYDDWIDHSYDSISDNAERLNAVLTEVKRLSAIPTARWAEILYEMLPTIISNNKNFTRAHSRSIQNKFLEKNT